MGGILLPLWAFVCQGIGRNAALGAEFGGKQIPLASVGFGIGMTRFREVRFFLAWVALSFSASIAAANWLWAKWQNVQSESKMQRPAQ
jgi:hypothetical protein